MTGTNSHFSGSDTSFGDSQLSSDSLQIFLGGPWGVSWLAYKQQKFVLHSSGAGSPKTKVPADSVSGEGLLLGSCVFT